MLAFEEACLNSSQQQPLYCVLPDTCRKRLCSMFFAQHFPWVFSVLSRAGAQATPSSLASSVLDLGPSWSASATPSFAHRTITWLSMKARARCRARCGGGIRRSSKRSNNPQSQVIRAKAHRGGDWDQFLSSQGPFYSGTVTPLPTFLPHKYTQAGPASPYRAATESSELTADQHHARVGSLPSPRRAGQRYEVVWTHF